jgi:hypothetical protein
MTADLVITLVISVFGWVIVHFLSARRDRKKEWREFARATAAYVDEIEKHAVIYHTNPERDIALEKKLKADIDYLDKRIEIIKRHLSFADIFLYRIAITLENFETKGFASQPVDSNIIRDIGLSGNQLRDNLYEAD